MSEQTQVEVIDPPVALCDDKEFKFRFRKDKELGTQRSTIIANVPILNAHGVADILNNGYDDEGNASKELKLLLEAVEDTVRYYALELVNGDESITSANFPAEKLSWTAIANIDRSDRRSNSIPEELWTAWATHYMEIMPGLTGKEPKQCSNAAKVFVRKLKDVKTNKGILRQLVDQLAVYINNTTRGEEFSEILTFLQDRAETYLKADDIEQMLNNL